VAPGEFRQTFQRRHQVAINNGQLQEAKLKLLQFAGWEGRLAPAWIECHLI
jgi:hypothetical protein